MILCCYLHVMIAIAIVKSHSGCSCCCCDVPVVLGGKDVMVTKILIEDTIIVNDKGLLKEASKNVLDCNYN